MDRDCFKTLLIKATGEALVFARHFLFNRIPTDVRYEIEHQMNEVFAIDQDVESTVDILWRGGLIPIWIDIKVQDVRHHATIIRLQASEQYVEKYSETYYAERDTGPFGVKSPNIPWPIALLNDDSRHRYFLGRSWLQWQLNCLIFRWWSLLGECSEANMNSYKKYRWKRPKW